MTTYQTNATHKAVEQIIDAGHFADQHQWVPATSGNFSARIDTQHIAITRSGCDKGQLTPDHIAIVDLHTALPADLSAEAPLHIARYRSDPSIGAIYHIHSLTAAVTARHYLAQQHLDFEGWELQKAFAGCSSHAAVLRVLIFANSQNTTELAQHVEQQWINHVGTTLCPGYLLAGHGLYAWGKDHHQTLRHLTAFDMLLQQQLALATL